MAITKLARALDRRTARKYLGSRLRAVVDQKKQEAKIETWERGDDFRTEDFYESLGFNGDALYHRMNGRSPFTMEEFGRLAIRLEMDDKEIRKFLKLASEVPLM